MLKFSIKPSQVYCRYTLMIITLIIVSSFSLKAQFAGGTGTVSDPYQIANVTQLQAMNTALDKHFILIQNIDATITSTWNSGAGFEPIGLTTSAAFSGTFDGKGFVISKLYINRPSNSGVGLFGNAFTFLTNIVSIKNVGLDSVYVKGSTRVGALVGNKELKVVNCYSSGIVEGGSDVGGLIGRNGGLVDSCHSSCNVSGGNRTGGLAGTGSNIKNSYATGNVTGIGEVGGFIGGISSNASLVYNCYATGNVTATGNFPNAGGFIGRAQAGFIDLCYATGTVTAAKAAGFIYSANAGTVKRCYSTSTVTSTSNEFNMYLAGFIGDNEGQVRDCYSLAKIKYDINNTGANIAGFVGRNQNNGKIYNCYTSAKINATNATKSAFAHSNEKSSNNLDTGKIFSCYYNIDTTGSHPAIGIDQGGVAVVTSLSDVLMRKQSSFASWNFDTTWNIIENQSYPFLRTPGSTVGCTNTFANDSVVACDQFTWINGVTYLVNTDTPQFTIMNAAGCDSIVTLKLTIYSISNAVIVNANVLTAKEAGASYQWIDCSSNTPIPNQTAQTFTATQTGNYKVIITKDICSDTSDCINVVISSIDKTTTKKLNVYPNPTTDRINFMEAMDGRVEVYNNISQLVYLKDIKGESAINLSSLPAGIYFMKLNSIDGNVYQSKIIIQQ